MTTSTTPNPDDPPPSSDHLRPPKPPEVRPTPANLNPTSPVTLPAPSPATTLPELRPPVAVPSPPAIPIVVSSVAPVDTPGIEEVDMEVNPNYGQGYMAIGGSFGKITPNELIQARKHLEAAGHELLKSNLEWKMKQGKIVEDVLSSEEEEEVEDDDTFKSPLNNVENVEFRNLMNGALAKMRLEQEEIREVDALLGDIERERLRKGKNVVDFPIPATGTPSPASFPASVEAPILAGPPLVPLAGSPLVLEGNPSSNSLKLATHKVQKSSLARAPIPSITSITSTLPSIYSSSNLSLPLPTLLPSPLSLDVNHTNKIPSIHNTSSSNPTGLPGQPLTGQISTNFSNLLPKPFPNPAKKTHVPVPHSGREHSGASSSWASLLKSQPRMALGFVKPSFNELGVLTLDKGTSNEGEVFWKHTLVGYSVDRRVPFKLLQQRVMALWGGFGIKEVRVNKEGFFFFSFGSEEGVESVLKKGPWIVLGQQIHLKPWKRNFEFCKEEFKSIPNWIKLFGIPTTYWSHSGLSAIASHVGIPLYADEITSSAKILDFARVCVQMEVGSKFPLSFKVRTEFDEEFEVRVEYSWRPRQCDSCKVFGHPTTSCPKLHPKPSSSNPIMNPPRQPNRTKLVYKPIIQSGALVVAQSKLVPFEASPIELGVGVPSPVAVLSEGTGPLGKELVLGENSSTISPSTNSFAILEEGELGENTLEQGSVSLAREVEEGKQALDIVATGKSGSTVAPVLDALDGETSISPIRWGHKIKMVDELDKKKKKNVKRSELRRKKRTNDASIHSPLGLVDKESTKADKGKESPPGISKEAKGCGVHTPSP